MLDNYTYETTLLCVSTRLLQGDVHNLLAQRFRLSRKGVCLRTDRCALCQHSLNRALVTFQHCRHTFHVDCLPYSDQRQCVLCYPVAITAHVNDSSLEKVASTTSPARIQQQVSQQSLMSNKLSPVQLESVVAIRKRLSSQPQEDLIP